jgi:AraC-like DNA-binding protein
LVETARARGVTIEALLAGTHLLPEVFEVPEARLSYDEYGILIRNALKLTGDSALGIEVGKHLGAGQMGVLGLALMTSRTVGEAFDVWLQYAPALASSWELSLSAEPPNATLVAREAIPHRPFEVYATELLFSATLTIARQLLGAELPVRGVQLAYSRPPHADRCPEVYARAEFDRDVTRMTFDAAALDAAIPFADPATAKLARRYCAEQLPPDPAQDALVPKVRRILATSVGKPPNLDQLARTLQTSPRTLRRIFDQMGTSYRELLDESRRTRAVEWSRSASLSVGTIAERLGFRDIRSFRRAFKRWTGHPPGAPRHGRA